MIRRSVTIAAIAMAALACASGARGGDSTPDGRPRGNMDAITALKELCELLTRDELSPAVARDALARSSAVWVRAGRVVSAADDTEPNHVELELPTPVARDAFERAFGAGTEAPLLHPHSPIEVLYYPAAPADRHHSCAIIARVAADGIRAVAVRRDPRL